MKISVIIPTHNRREYLNRSLSSVLNQTHSPDEIIIVDDGSTDDTIKWLNKSHPAITVITQPNQGVSAARNTGIKHATGTWLSFLDSDDEWAPTKLENQVGLLTQNPNYKVCHANDIWYRNNVRVNPPKHYKKPQGKVFNACLERCVISPSSIIIHRDVLKHVGLFDESLLACEDYDLWLRIFAHYELLYINEPLSYKYDGHEGQLSNQRGLEKYRIESLYKIIQDNQLSHAQQSAALKTLQKKATLYLSGAHKHNNKAGIAFIQKINTSIKVLDARHPQDTSHDPG